jgi:hypothetical protein
MRFWGWEKWCRDDIRAWQRVAILAKKDGVARFMQEKCLTLPCIVRGRKTIKPE